MDAAGLTGVLQHSENIFHVLNTSDAAVKQSRMFSHAQSVWPPKLKIKKIYIFSVGIWGLLKQHQTGSRTNPNPYKRP